jgi:hypothetical protein
MVFDQYGRIKYSIGKSIRNAEMQSERLQSLWTSGFYSRSPARTQPFAAMHRQRALAWGQSADEAEAVAWMAAGGQ